jgi:hypothetical protein
MRAPKRVTAGTYERLWLRVITPSLMSLTPARSVRQFGLSQTEVRKARHRRPSVDEEPIETSSFPDNRRPALEGTRPTDDR